MNEQRSIYEMVENIVQVVFYTYYNYIKDPDLKEDLFQIGYLKAYELLNNGNYDPTMSFRNFIYTGVRNEMHNALYHLNKIKTVDLEQLDKYDNIVGYHELGDYNIDIEFIKGVLSRYSRLGNYFPSIINYLIDLKVIESSKYKENREELDPNILNGLITLVLWELYERERENEYSR